MSSTQSSSQSSQSHKQIVLPPLCMPPQSFPQPCCPPPCFYPPPCFPCCQPNPCCPQPCCPPSCPLPACCPPVCCSPCVPCCPKVPCAPCCPPQCGPSNQTKSRCNCCGGRSTLICVPRGAPPPCRPCCPPCCPCPPQCCGDNSSSDKPPSFNNCNFYCSELPKGFGGQGSNPPEQVQDECIPEPECCPDYECDDYGGNRAAGDDQLAPIPRGLPGQYSSQGQGSRTKNNWNYDPKPTPTRRSGGRGRGQFRGGRKRGQFDFDDVQGSQCSEDMSHPPRIPPRNGYNRQDQWAYEEGGSDCEPVENEPSFATYHTTATTTPNSFKGSSFLSHHLGPVVSCKGERSEKVNVDSWSGTQTPPLRRNKLIETKQLPKTVNEFNQSTPPDLSDMATETEDKAATAPVQTQRTTLDTATGPLTTILPTLRGVSKIPKAKALTASGVEVRSQLPENVSIKSKLSTYKTPGANFATPRVGGGRRKFKNPGKLDPSGLYPDQNLYASRPGDRRVRTNDLDPNEMDTKEIDKLLWVLIPSAATPISTLNIFGPNCPDIASSDFISAPPTQPGCPVNCDLIKIQSGSMVKTRNEMPSFCRRRARSCDYQRKRHKRRTGTALECSRECELICNFDDPNPPATCPRSVLCHFDDENSRQSSVVCETLASILKKKTPLKCKGIDSVKFARDFCVMTCFVERSGQGSSRKNDCCPSPVIIIPPPSFNPNQWKNYQFNSTPSCHLTGCAPCTPCTKLPPINSHQRPPKSKFSFQNCGSPCPNFCSLPCRPCSPYQCPIGCPGSPYMSPCPTPTKKKHLRKHKRNLVGSPSPARSPSPTRSPLEEPQGIENKQESVAVEDLDPNSEPPPRPPPPVPPRKPPPHPPPPVSKVSSKASSYLSRPNSRQSSNIQVKQVDSGFGYGMGSEMILPKVKSESTHTWSPQCCILPPCYLHCPPSPDYCPPIQCVEKPRAKPSTFHPISPTDLPPIDPKLKPEPDPKRKPEKEKDVPSTPTKVPTVPPPSVVKIPPYPYGMKHPPKSPALPLVLPSISPRLSLPPLDEDEDPPDPPSSSLGKPPKPKLPVKDPPKSRYYEFLPRNDCCKESDRKTKKAKRRCQCPNNFRRLPIKKGCCCTPEECCPPDPPCPPKSNCCTNPCC